MDEINTEEAPRASGRHPLQTIWQYRWHVLLGLVVGIAISGVLYARRPVVYQSSAQVLVIKKRSDALPMAGGDPRMLAYEDYVSTHLILIRSPIVIQRAITKGNLGSLTSFQGKDPVGAIRGGLVANRDNPAGGGGNNIISISFACGDSADTETVLNAVIETYHEYLGEAYQNVSKDTLDQINKAQEILNKQLVAKEEKWQAFRLTAPLLPKGGDGTNTFKVMYEGMQKEEDLLLRREAEILKRLDAIKEGRGVESAEVLLALANQSFDRNAAPLLPPTTDHAREIALHPLLIKEKELSRYYGKEHAEVISVREQIEATKELYGKLEAFDKKGGQEAAGSGEGRLEARLRLLHQELKVIATAISALRGRMKETEKKARDLEHYEDENKLLWDDVTRTQQLLNVTLQRLQQIDVIRDSGGYQAKVIAPPGPGNKTSPILFQFLAMGCAIGLALGVGGAFFLEFADKSFRTPEEIRRQLGLPLVGHIPFMPLSDPSLPVGAAGSDTANLDAALAIIHRPNSAAAEAFRAVRTALYFNTRGERHKVIQVTSPHSGDGKTTLITNLAISIAQSGRKILLIDADLRKPRIHRVFNIPGKVGLAEVIAGTADLASTIQPSIVPNLSLLPCGRRPPNPAELLTSPRFEEFLDDLRNEFDFVLIDTPPIMAVSDPCIVASRVDGIILTIRVAKNGRLAAVRARDLLSAISVKIFGVVVNGVGKHGTTSGYTYDQYNYTQEYSEYYYSDDPERPSEQNAANKKRPELIKALRQRSTRLRSPGSNGTLPANGVHQEHSGEEPK